MGGSQSIVCDPRGSDGSGNNKKKNQLKGSCLCGQVKFHFPNPQMFQAFYCCHCTQCQKATGSAHAANLFTGPENIEWTNGSEDWIQRYTVPGRTITKAFCRTCGAAVPYVSESGQVIVVPAGCLDGPAPLPLTPDYHIFWAERAAWYDEGLHAPTVPGFPEHAVKE